MNGSGKSTLLKIIAGLDQNYIGKIESSKDFSVGYLEQEPLLDNGKTVIEVIREGKKEIFDMLTEFEEIGNKFMEPMSDDEMTKLLDRQGLLQDKIDAANAWEIDQVLNRAMDALQCPDPEAKIETLSGGERRRVALCRLLLQEPDVLLLDEPTNHLDAESVLWLEHHLAQYRGTVICITHDRYFLDNVAGWILELDRGEGIPWKGNYSSWLDQKAIRMGQEEKVESKRRKVLERELDWVRQGVKGRQAKSKARLKNYEQMLEEDVKQNDEKLELYIPPGPRLGSKVIVANDVAKGFGDRLLYEHLNFSLPQGGIVGIIGPNGAGKTTLFRMIMGEEQPLSGTFEIGETVKIAYVDQAHSKMDPEKTVFDVISNGDEWIETGKLKMNSRAYVSRFNFNGADQQKKLKVLSGGERNRLHLAMTLREEANVLLLDEPTNDLDINTIRSLEEALNNYAGCAVVISHDRWFLDRVCTHILAFEGEGTVYFFEGGFSEYEENRKARLGEQPKRFKYKKLVG
jgi:sulfate-transporting ATPase